MADQGERRRRSVPGLSAISGRVSDDLASLAQNLRALPEAVEYLRKLTEGIEQIADDTARMRAATERLDKEVVQLNEKFEAVEASVHDLARALRPIRSRRRARERAANGKDDPSLDTSEQELPPSPDLD